MDPTEPGEPAHLTLGPKRRRSLLALAAVLFIAGAVLVVVAATHQDHAPRPSAAAAGRITATTAAPPSSTSGSPTVPATTAAASPPVAGAPPVHLDIAAIGVHSDVIALGLNPDRSLQAPQPGPDYDKAAWYRYSPTPGSVGPSVIEGHVDSKANGPSVFFKLGALQPSDQIVVTLADHQTATFTVLGVREYTKDQFPTSAVYGNTTDAALRLITCGGPFDQASGHYRDNVVVYATLTDRTG